jgi:hypothetical protein
MKERIDEQVIMERTGHRSTTAVRMYKRTSADFEKEVSDCLQPPMPRSAHDSTSPSIPPVHSDLPNKELTDIVSRTPVDTDLPIPTPSHTVCSTPVHSDSPKGNTTCTVSKAPLDTDINMAQEQIMISVKKGDKEVKILL